MCIKVDNKKTSPKKKSKKNKTDAQGRVIRHTSLPQEVDDKLVGDNSTAMVDRKISDKIRVIIKKYYE